MPKNSAAQTNGPPSEHWKNQPDEHDYPAAQDYLSLLLRPENAAALVTELKATPLVHRKAKDLLRASRLALLPIDNPHVLVDLKKVKKGDLLSPILLIRGSLCSGMALTIADGYHRICASYHLDENADIPCRIADAPFNDAPERS
jgi:hypothetical protein